MKELRLREKVFSPKKVLIQLVESRWSLPVIIFVSYFLLNLGIKGPAYLSDEVAYLDKAATIAGSVVHLSTSWFGGYSFMISPAFLLSSNPYTEWTIVLVLNAAMWAGSAALLRYLLLHLYPKRSSKVIWLVAFGSMLYPSWISMSGYAFSTSGFVLVFMASLVTLLKSDFTRRSWLILSALLAGYLCWIHPLGFAFLGLVIVVFILKAVVEKSWRLPLFGLIGVVFALVYVTVTQPLLNYVMRGSSVNDNHYIDGLFTTLRAIPTLHYWEQASLLLIGLLASVIIATFGIALHGAVPFIRDIYSKRSSFRLVLQDTQKLIQVIPFVLIMTVVVLTALYWGSDPQLRIDQWIYGRYTDMYLLPLIAFGLLASWRLREVVMAVGFTAVAGVVLTSVTNHANTIFAYDNKVNIQGFWPMQLTSLIHANYYWLWGILGAIGVGIVGIIGIKYKRSFLFILLVPISVTAAGNYIYHHTLLEQHSTVSSLYSYVKDTYPTSECIGFTPNPDGNESFNLYSYYLHGYDIEKMTFAEWKDNNCPGPYFTYTLPAILPTGMHVSGIEKSIALYMVTRTKQPYITFQ